MMRQFLSLWALLCLLLTGCQDDSLSSQLNDIYTNDAETRHAATEEEMLWTIQLSGCTAAALSPEYVITANHCGPSAGDTYTSGASLASGGWGNGDIQAVEVVESDYAWDYSIVKVRWENAENQKRQKYPPFVATKKEDLVEGKDGEGTKLFTVGFPGDKRVATYAEGYAKEYRDHQIAFNVPIINGNSGGSIWTADTKMLVTMTNDGPTQIGMPGWDNNDPEDAAHWNYSVAMYRVYEKSEILRDIFPDGNNRFADDNGNME